MKRFWLFEDIPDDLWLDWKWQYKNRLHNNSAIRSFFPNISRSDERAFNHYTKRYFLSVTPYVLSLVDLDPEKNPKQNDPIWNQFRFLSEGEMQGDTDYDGTTQNWERPHEMPTTILHHKYPDRAIVRISNSCFGHCNYCYLTSRILDRDAAGSRRDAKQEWERSLEYLRAHREIGDVLISGGDPLLLSNERIAGILSSLAGVPSIKSVRINTRVFTFNPYRFDEELVSIFKQYRLTALEMHMAHPRELTGIVDEKLGLFESVGYRPLLLWRSPLLQGINSSRDVLEELFIKLYRRRIKPYYLFHYAPFSIGRARYGVSIRNGIRLLEGLRRSIPGPAFPEFTLFHVEGKCQIPFEPEGTPNFRYTRDAEGKPVVEFKNWKDHWVTYPDVEESERTAAS